MYSLQFDLPETLSQERKEELNNEIHKLLDEAMYETLCEEVDALVQTGGN